MREKNSTGKEIKPGKSTLLDPYSTEDHGYHLQNEAVVQIQFHFTPRLHTGQELEQPGWWRA